MEVQNKLDEEAATFKDIVQGNFMDTYRNLTYKNIMGKHWVANYCPQAEFVIKTDDDMFIDMYGTYHITRNYVNDERYAGGNFMMGGLVHGSPILRGGQWTVSLAEISAEESASMNNVYPPAHEGTFYITNPKTAARLVEMASITKFFWIDDVYVTGILAQKLNISHVDIKEYKNLATKVCLRIKAAQSPGIFNKDILATRMERNYELSTLLHQYSRFCYFNKCFNNIYFKHHNVTEEENKIIQTIQKWIVE